MQTIPSLLNYSLHFLKSKVNQIVILSVKSINTFFEMKFECQNRQKKKKERRRVQDRKIVQEVGQLVIEKR